MLIQQFRPIQLLDQLLVDARLAWRSLGAQLTVDEVENAGFQFFAIALGFLVHLWTVVSIV